jgi:hypothetical protein
MFRKLAGLTAVAGLFIAGTASAQSIAGSPHDFSLSGWAGGQICIACHTPHNSITEPSGLAPLWNHTLTTATFTLYTGVDMQATPGDPVAAGGISLLCLSCHDGTVALDSYGGATGSVFIGGAANVGTDLSDDHPIVIDFNATLQPDMNDPATTNSGVTGGTTVAADMLFGGVVECASCHNVHNESGQDELLIRSNAGSGMCQVCHGK